MQLSCGKLAALFELVEHPQNTVHVELLIQSEPTQAAVSRQKGPIT